MIHSSIIGLRWWASTWTDAVEGGAPCRFTTDKLMANIRIFDALTRSAAAGGKPIAL